MNGPIRVAYDITAMGHEYGRTDGKHGIVRVSEEIVHGLARRADVRIKMVGMCADDFVFGALNCAKLHETDPELRDLEFVDTLGSRFGARAVLETLHGVYSRPAWSQEGSWRRRLFRAVFRACRRLDGVRAFAPDDYDLFHSPQYALPSRSITGSLPRVLTVADMIPLVAPQHVLPNYTQFYQRVINAVDRERDWVICISEHTRQDFCQYTGMAPERTFVTPLAAARHMIEVQDQERIRSARERYGIPEGPYLLGLASFLEPRKNVAQILRAFAQLIAQQPELKVNLVLVGTQRIRQGNQIYEELLKPISGRVCFTGFVQEQDLGAIYSGAAAFVYPSLYEGFGMPPFEAMQCGAPVIASNTTSIPEVVGSAGLLVNPTDTNQIAGAMFDLLTDGALAADLRAKGKAQAASFSWDKCAELTAEAYGRILAA